MIKKDYTKSVVIETYCREIPKENLINEKADLLERLSEIDADLLALSKVK